MEEPVREWIEQHSLEMRGQFLLKSDKMRGNIDMIVTKDRLDAWAIKGLDGLGNMLLERSAQNTPIDLESLRMMAQDMERLQRILDCNQTSSMENTDCMLFAGLRFMSIFLHQRVFEMNLGGLNALDKGRLREYLERCKIAIGRFRKTIKER